MLLPVFTDSHVHLGLVDPSELVSGGIGRVLDLGWDPEVAFAADGLIIDRAGPLLAAPGGYPLRAGWAPREAVREIQDVAAAASAVASLTEMRARVAKITLNAEAGPVWDDELLAFVVTLAHDAGLPVIAHAQGAGQAERALHAGVDVLAHTPWTESLSHDVIMGMVSRRMRWISTLDIHGWGDYGADYTRAMSNLEHFLIEGGTVLYGTDLGNGPLPVGLNRRELESLAAAGVRAGGWAHVFAGLEPAASGAHSVIDDLESMNDLTVDALMTARVIP